MTTIMSEDYR